MNDDETPGEDTDDASPEGRTDDASPEGDDAGGDGAAADGPSEEPPDGPSGDWTDRIVGERMQLDREFSEKVAASHFSRQQWGLIMTAVEFEVENPTDPERARLVADTSKLEAVIPELDDMSGGTAGGMPGAGGGPGGSSGGGSTGGGGGGGFLDSVKDALGLGSDESEREQLAAAEEMAQMYADELQEKLRERGKWEMVRVMAQEH